MLENKMLYICNDVLTFSSKGHGPTLREGGVGGGGGGERFIRERWGHVYRVFRKFSWISWLTFISRCKFSDWWDVFELRCFERVGWRRISSTRESTLVFSPLRLNYDKLHFPFLFSWTDTVYGFVLTRCCEFIDAFTGCVILCKAAVNVDRVVSFSPSRWRFSQEIQTQTPWFHTSWIHLLGRVMSVSDLWRGRTKFPWG